MNVSDFMALHNARWIKSDKTLVVKAREYACPEERLRNFYDGAQLAQLTPEQYAFALVTKHIVALRDALNDPNEEYHISEEFIDEKIGDIINYMILIEALLRERYDYALTSDVPKRA